MLRNYLRHAGGSVAPLFAIAAIPVLGAAGAAVDFSRAYQERTVIQDALDAAALSGGRKIGAGTTQEIKDEVDRFYFENVGEKIDNPPPLEMNVNGGTITLNTTLRVPTFFLRIMGLDEITFNMATAAKAGMGTLEVVLALDNSTSMSGSKISTLRDAATQLTNKLFALESTSTQPDPVKIGLVPFAAAVNVGPQNASAAWLDDGGIGTYHADTLDGTSTDINVFDLFEAIEDAAWAGCVEARPIPYDVSDTAAVSGNPSTMFVPMFAPDAPDNWTCSSGSCSYAGSWSSRRYNGAPGGGQNYNNYLPDNGGVCSGGNSKWTCADGDPNCGGTNVGVSESTAYKRSCKYGSASNRVDTASISVGGIPGGPNFMCTTPALQPLTTNKNTVLARISDMNALGATNILSGAVWAWRVLSSDAPFTQGRAYDELDNNKFLILMTDGANTYYPKSNSNLLKSWYGAFGFVAKGHLGTTSTSASTLANKMNDRTIEACSNIKAAGITIYTVGFDLSGSQSEIDRALEVVTECASGADKYFTPNSNAELLAAFTAIGDSITSLRVSM